MGTSKGMGDLADEAKNETDDDLRLSELQILAETPVDWTGLRPKIADQETYDALIDIVKAASAGNESLAQLKARIEALGTEGIAVARKVIGLIGVA